MNAKSVPPELTTATQVELTELQCTAALKAQTQSHSKETLHDDHHAIHTPQIQAAHNINEALPISRLPPEVLKMVFHEACRMLARWSHAHRPLSAEVLLSHVCRRWRAVALGSCALWTILRVPVLCSKPIVETYLERCGQCPLTVHLGSELTNHRIMDILTSVVIPHISQVKALILNVCGCQGLYTVLRILENVAAPSLRQLSIMTTGHSYNQVAFSPCKIFRHGAPLLSEVRLGRIPITLPPAPVSVLHFDLFSLLPVTPHSPLHLLNMIRLHSGSLMVLHLKGDVSKFQDEPQDDPIELPALQELEVFGSTSNIFQGISAPSLRSLTFDYVEQQYLSMMHNFMIYTHPEHFCNLQSLHYIDCSTDAKVDIHLLDATAALEELSITVNFCHPHLLKLLLKSDKWAVMHGRPRLWPRLHTLTIHVWMMTWFEGMKSEDEVHPVITLLPEVVQLRKAVGSKLDMLQIKGPHAREFYDSLATALARVEAEMEVVVEDKHSTELDWTKPGQFYDTVGRCTL